MDRSLSFFESGKIEGIMTVLQELSVKDGFTIYATKEYIVEKLTELNLTKYIPLIIEEYYTEN